MGCCQYHRSFFTYGAIFLTFIVTFLSVVSVWPFAIGLITLVLLSGTCCCKLHRYVLYVACVLALIAAIGCFVAAGEGLCPDGSKNCNEKVVRELGIFAGVFWLLDIILIYMIPTGPQERRNSGTSPNTFNQEHAGETV